MGWERTFANVSALAVIPGAVAVMGIHADLHKYYGTLPVVGMWAFLLLRLSHSLCG